MWQVIPEMYPNWGVVVRNSGRPDVRTFRYLFFRYLTHGLKMHIPNAYSGIKKKKFTFNE